MFRRWLASALAVGVGFFAPGCSTNPATGERILTLLPRSEEVRIGMEAAPQFTAEFGGATPSPALQDYVTRIGRSMMVHTEADYPELPWEFTLLDSDTINAFALPGGKVFISRGLAEQMTNEAQLAGVIGHEIGHVTAQHSNQRISNTAMFNLILAGAAVSVAVADSDSDYRRYGQVAVPALAVGGNLVLLKFGRDEELQADMLGVRYMTRVGYDPRGAREVMELLQSLSGGARQPEFLSTHPDPASRINQIQRLMQGEYAHTQNNPQFQLHEARFQQEFLSIVKGLPPPAHKHSRRILNGEAMAALGPPSSWCAHCAGGEE